MAGALTADIAPRSECRDAAVGVCALPLIILQRRADFLRAASARRQGTAGFLLQARHRRDDEPVPEDSVRIGFTCSKKLGNAVARNRAKRRLRALAREIMPVAAQPGWDYVLVGRPEATATREFALLRADLLAALDRVHSARAPVDAPGPVPSERRRGER